MKVTQDGTSAAAGISSQSQLQCRIFIFLNFFYFFGFFFCLFCMIQFQNLVHTIVDFPVSMTGDAAKAEDLYY